ncbi:MAG: histone deacetylase, partial [Candidatus Bathyarchaeia archaeon]
MYIVFSEKCLEYWEPGHPESPERVYNVYRLLREKEFKFISAEPCAEEDLLLVHKRDFIEKIKNGAFYDSDTANLPGMYEYARLSAGAAIKSMRLALNGEKAFSLMRPPGHHAGINGRALGAPSLGFCYFNNIAIACKKALSEVKKVAIIDIDCHHGNGTQEIFFKEPRVLYVSLHRHGVYPGTGGTSEGNCLNYPLRSHVGESEYLETLKSALKKVKQFNPNLTAVSAGFDTHKRDPVCGLGLSEEVYSVIGMLIARLKREIF